MGTIGDRVMWLWTSGDDVRALNGTIVNLFSLGALRFVVVLLTREFMHSKFCVVEEDQYEISSSGFENAGDEQRDATDK